jgi:REP element-mobilizing transposase RayT
MARGNRKNVIFHDALDRMRFLSRVGEVERKYSIRIFAYCLMPNHYHLVLDTPRGNLSDAMQYLNGVYAQITNKRYDQSGHVFGERFRSLLIEQEGYLKRASRYVVRNPVRAQIATTAEDARWSSYRATAGIEPAPAWLNIEWILWAFKSDGLEEAQRRYVRYVNEPRRANSARDGRQEVYGSAEFKARVEAAWRETQAERRVPRLVAPAGRPALETLFRDTGDSKPRRDLAIRISRIEHGYRVAEIARFLAVHPSTVSRAVDRDI